MTLGATANGEKGFNGSFGEFRIFNRVISEDEARMAAAWPAIAAAASRDRAAALRLRDGRAEALLPDVPRRRLSGAVGGICTREPEHREIELRSNTAMVLEERSDSKPSAHLLFRGMYDQPRERLDAALPSFLPPMAPELPRNRLGLARWIIDRGNPLFARVTVNRFWQELFGSGILESADDFGAQALQPSHPELLDWLAVEFRESGWDVKQLIALIVTSATYRQSATISQDKLRSDPKNILLARGPRFRLDGEVVRDGRWQPVAFSWRSSAARPLTVPPGGCLGRHVDGLEQHAELQTGCG